MPHARATTKELLAKLEAENPQIFVSMKAAFSNIQLSTFFYKNDVEHIESYEEENII
jgi:tRNA 2-thiocytidine biosynthesis protein TtcA